MSDGRWIACCACKEPIWMRSDLEVTLRRSQQNWHCLWGHAQHFPKGETEAEKYRRERDLLKQNEARLEQRVATLREQRDAAERSRSAVKGQVTRLKNRVANGVCPCCNRTFANLQRHMTTKHAGFVAEEVQAEAGQTIQ